STSHCRNSKQRARFARLARKIFPFCCVGFRYIGSSWTRILIVPENLTISWKDPRVSAMSILALNPPPAVGTMTSMLFMRLPISRKIVKLLFGRFNDFFDSDRFQAGVTIVLGGRATAINAERFPHCLAGRPPRIPQAQRVQHAFRETSS